MFKKPNVSNTTFQYSAYHESAEEKYIMNLFMISFVFIVAVGLMVLVQNIFSFRRNQAVIKKAVEQGESDIVIDVHRRLENRREGIYLPFNNPSMKTGMLILGKS